MKPIKLFQRLSQLIAEKAVKLKTKRAKATKAKRGSKIKLRLELMVYFIK
jgi:hypothetical protein